MSAVQTHPFTPGADGSTCNQIQYPEWKRCEKGPRAKVHNGERPEPPELEFPYPPCSMCGEDTYHDGDGFRCDPCGAYWGERGAGSWMEPGLKACGATRKPFDRGDLEPKYEGIRHHKDYCIREAGHDGSHRANAYSEWTATS